MEGLIVFIWCIIFVVWIFGLICAGSYAERLGRSLGGWLVVALLISPIFVAILLYMLGETNEHRKARIIEEERWRRSCDAEVQQENNNTPQKEDIVDILN